MTNLTGYLYIHSFEKKIIFFFVRSGERIFLKLCQFCRIHRRFSHRYILIWVCLSVYLSFFCLSVIYLCIMYVCLFVRLSVCLCIMYICQSVCLLCINVRLSVCQGCVHPVPLSVCLFWSISTNLSKVYIFSISNLSIFYHTYYVWISS